MVKLKYQMEINFILHVVNYLLMCLLKMFMVHSWSDYLCKIL